MLVQMSISRSREYAADRGGAEIAGHPLWLASALAKIDDYAHQIPNETAEEVPATAHMFIINPLTGGGMDNLFSTHPNTANRIAALQQLAAELGTQAAPSVGANRIIGRRARGAARLHVVLPMVLGADSEPVGFWPSFVTWRTQS